MFSSLAGWKTVGSKALVYMSVFKAREEALSMCVIITIKYRNRNEAAPNVDDARCLIYISPYLSICTHPRRPNPQILAGKEK